MTKDSHLGSLLKEWIKMLKDNGKLWKKDVKQWKKEHTQKLKDITRPKTYSHPGLAVDLRHMPSTCPCRASIQGYRGSSQYWWGGVAVETSSDNFQVIWRAIDATCWLGDMLKACNLVPWARKHTTAPTPQMGVCFNPDEYHCCSVYRVSFLCMVYFVKVFRIQSHERPKSTAKASWKELFYFRQLLVHQESCLFHALLSNLWLLWQWEGNTCTVVPILFSLALSCTTATLVPTWCQRLLVTGV